MADWNSQRVEINRRVRTVLVSHFIDLSRISVHVYPKKVNIRGFLTKLEGAGGSLTPDKVRLIIEEIERIPGVKRVLATLENWQRGGYSNWVDTTMSGPRNSHKDKGGAAEGEAGDISADAPLDLSNR